MSAPWHKLNWPFSSNCSSRYSHNQHPDAVGKSGGLAGGSGRIIMGRDYDMTHTNGMNHWFTNFLASHILGKGWEALQPAKGQKPAPIMMLILSSKPSGFSALQLVYFLNLRFLLMIPLEPSGVCFFFSCDEKLFMLSLMYTSRTFKLGFISWHVDPQPVAWEYCQQLHSPWPLVAEKNGLVEWTSWSSRVDFLEYSNIYLDRYIIVTIIIIYLIICTYKYLYIYINPHVIYAQFR